MKYYIALLFIFILDFAKAQHNFTFQEISELYKEENAEKIKKKYNLTELSSVKEKKIITKSFSVNISEHLFLMLIDSDESNNILDVTFKYVDSTNKMISEDYKKVYKDIYDGLVAANYTDGISSFTYQKQEYRLDLDNMTKFPNDENAIFSTQFGKITEPESIVSIVLKDVKYLELEIWFSKLMDEYGLLRNYK